MKIITFFPLVCFLFTDLTYPITIILDPGHGGKFTGCLSYSRQVAEKNITLSISKKLIEQLKNYRNIKVISTRALDTQLAEELIDDLHKRVEIAQINEADLFISLHLNATLKDPETTRGFEIYVPMHTNYPAQSYLLACFIHHSLSQNIEPSFSGNLGNLNIRDQGIRAAKFNVIFKAPCPAVLIELDYLTHPDVEQLYLSEEYQDFIATALANAILDYLNYIQ